MKKLKVMTIVGTRPEIIRLSCVIKKLDTYTENVLVHTGQNYDYELNQVFFEDLEIRKPDHFLEAASTRLAETIGQIISKADIVMEKENPDAVLVLGDTNSCLSVIPAKRRKIPIFHMEAGNRCFDQRVPEEINRKIVDHISDINMPYSDIAREYLLKEGFPADRIIKTGSPMFEVLNINAEKIDRSTILEQLNIGLKDYFIVSSHREENVDDADNLTSLIKMLNEIAQRYGKKVIVSTHPRTRKRIDQSEAKLHELVELKKPLGFLDYCRLQKEALIVLSDSGTISEESSILNFPALNIREAHERPEAMEEGAVMMTGMSLERIFQGIEILMNQPRGKERLIRIANDYAVPNVADKVVRIIESYTDYVNRVVWRKS